MDDRHKVWSAGRASQKELDEIDKCKLCKYLPDLANTCRDAAYCHRQLTMTLDVKGDDADDHR